MKTRAFAVLAGILALLALVALLADRAEERRLATPAGKLLPGFAADKAVRVETAYKGKTDTLEKKEGTWRVAPLGQLADAAAIGEALARLERLEKNEIASENPARHGDLEVKGDEATTVVKVWTEGQTDKPAVHLHVGKSGADYESSFVRVEGDSLVYRSREPIRGSFDRGSRGWRDRAVARFASDDAVRIDLFSGQATTLEKKDGTWQITAPEAGPAQAATVDTILRTLSSLDADEFVEGLDDAATGLGEGAWRSKVTLADGRTVELVWGAEADGGRVHVRVAGNDPIYQVQAYRKTSVFPTAEDLREAAAPPPEAPTAPAAAPTPTP